MNLQGRLLLGRKSISFDVHLTTTQFENNGPTPGRISFIECVLNLLSHPPSYFRSAYSDRRELSRFFWCCFSLSCFLADRRSLHFFPLAVAGLTGVDGGLSVVFGVVSLTSMGISSAEVSLGDAVIIVSSDESRTSPLSSTLLSSWQLVESVSFFSLQCVPELW